MLPAAFTHRLNALVLIRPEDLAVLEGMTFKERTWASGGVVFSECAQQNTARVVEDGWAIRIKTLADGRRQILSFVVPGDIFGVYTVLFETMEYGVEALTPLRLVEMPATSLVEAFRQSPRLGVSLCWMVGQDERLLEEQIVRVGRRRASERMAHLFMELHRRLLRAGMDGDAALHFPLTLPVLADALGMSPIHAHRSFRWLEQQGLVQRLNHHVVMRDIGGLAQVAGFNASYVEDVTLPSPTRSALKN